LLDHTETVEFIKFNHDGKLCITGGMNNLLRIWQVDENQKMTLKCKLENGPSETDDIQFVDWHPKGNAVICGGNDYMIWLMNGATGDFLANFSGHEDNVLSAQFTPNGGKLIVSSSADKTIRVWSPIK
jgi:WD40 repeat protein